MLTKTVMMAATPPQAGWFEDVPPGDKDCDDGGHSSSGWLVEELHTPRPTQISRSDASDWLHHDICSLSKFVLRVHPSVWI